MTTMSSPDLQKLLSDAGLDARVVSTELSPASNSQSRALRSEALAIEDDAPENCSNEVEPLGVSFAATDDSAAEVQKENKSDEKLEPVLEAPLNVPASDDDKFNLEVMPTLLTSRLKKVSDPALKPLSFVVDEVVDVWSSSKQAWVQGKVAEVFENGGKDEGYTVPAGVVKVSVPTGVKYIRPAQFGTELRKIKASGLALTGKIMW